MKTGYSQHVFAKSFSGKFCIFIPGQKQKKCMSSFKKITWNEQAVILHVIILSFLSNIGIFEIWKLPVSKQWTKMKRTQWITVKSINTVCTDCLFELLLKCGTSCYFIPYSPIVLFWSTEIMKKFIVLNEHLSHDENET